MGSETRGRGLLEQAFQNELIVELCKLPHTRAWRRNAGGARVRGGGFIKGGAKGTSDVYGAQRIAPGVALFFVVECKIHPEKPTAEQARYLAMVRDVLGGVAVLATARRDDTKEHAAAFWAGYVDEALRERRVALRNQLAGQAV